jgi:hypothetical protein
VESSFEQELVHSSDESIFGVLSTAFSLHGYTIEQFEKIVTVWLLNSLPGG